MNKENPAGLYIHVPFCVHKCRYCDFYSMAGLSDFFGPYEKRVREALDFYGEKLERRYNSLYFGGGTPLYFGEEHLSAILDSARPYLADSSEITAEGNPERGDRTDFERLKDAGINRLSLGLQSSDPGELSALGRIHSPADCETSVKRAQAAGIDNISLDLMIGIPYQTGESLARSIDFCHDLGVKHVSAYMLKIEEGTPLAGDPELCSLCAGEEETRDLYLLAVERLEHLGYRQYEISNFAVPGYESRHNLKYWNDEEYLGIGPGAHSFLGKRRFYFPRDLKGFLERPFSENETFESEGGGWDEYAALRFRLTEGLDTVRLAELYPESPADAILKRAGRFGDLVRISGSGVSMTPEGFLVSNALTAELLYG